MVFVLIINNCIVVIVKNFFIDILIVFKDFECLIFLKLIFCILLKFKNRLIFSECFSYWIMKVVFRVKGMM